MSAKLTVISLVLALSVSSCASANYKTKTGKEGNLWVDMLVVAAAMPTSSDSARVRARKQGIVSGYLAEKNEDEDIGNCPCPYDLAADGSRCGARSAWSKPYGADPHCDVSKITDQDVDEKYK